MPGHTPPIICLGDVNGNIPQYYYVAYFRILVIFAQRQHLVMYFIHCLVRQLNPKFVTESTQTPLRELTIKKNFKFYHLRIHQNMPLDITKEKKCSISRALPDERGTPAPPSALRPPIFELALTSLGWHQSADYISTRHVSSSRPYCEMCVCLSVCLSVLDGHRHSQADHTLTIYAQNPLHTSPRNFPIDEEVANLLQLAKKSL